MNFEEDNDILNEILNKPPVVRDSEKPKKRDSFEEDDQWVRDNKVDYLKKKTNYLDDDDKPSYSSTSPSSSSAPSSSSPSSSSFSITAQPQYYQKLSQKYKKGADLQSPQSPKKSVEERKEKENKEVTRKTDVPGDDVFLNELLNTDGTVNVVEEGKAIDEEWARIDKEKARIKDEDARLDENFERINRGQPPVGFVAGSGGDDGIDGWRAYFRVEEEAVVTAKRHVLYDIEKVNTQTRTFNTAVRGMGRVSEVRKIKTMVYSLNEDQLTPLPYKRPVSSLKH